jgi:hypothetical protein
VGCHQRGGTYHHSFSRKLQIVEKMLNNEDVKKWEIIMQEEYYSFIINNTWLLVPFPKGRNLISKNVQNQTWG